MTGIERRLRLALGCHAPNAWDMGDIVKLIEESEATIAVAAK
jgi:hypothetical protein